MIVAARLAALSAFVCALVLLAPGIAFADCAYSPNLCPMYGGIEKTDEMIAADEAFIAKTEEMGLSHREGAEISIALGWKYFLRGDPNTGMSRFNQAWILDPENGDIYHGMAAIVADRDRDIAASEALFQKAMALPRHSPVVYADYGYFLIQAGKADEAATFLQGKITEFPGQLNLRYNRAIALLVQGKKEQACEAGREAKQAGDPVQDGFLVDACGMN